MRCSTKRIYLNCNSARSRESLQWSSKTYTNDKLSLTPCPISFFVLVNYLIPTPVSENQIQENFCVGEAKWSKD